MRSWFLDTYTNGRFWSAPSTFLSVVTSISPTQPLPLSLSMFTTEIWVWHGSVVICLWRILETVVVGLRLWKIVSRSNSTYPLDCVSHQALTSSQIHSRHCLLLRIKFWLSGFYVFDVEWLARCHQLVQKVFMHKQRGSSESLSVHIVQHSCCFQSDIFICELSSPLPSTAPCHVCRSDNPWPVWVSDSSTASLIWFWDTVGFSPRAQGVSGDVRK